MIIECVFQVYLYGLYLPKQMLLLKANLCPCFFDSEVDSSASTHTKRSVKSSLCFNLNHVIPTPLNLS